MNFNYANFLISLRDNENESKREVYKKKLEFSNKDKLEEEPFYSYLFEFKPLRYRTPSTLKNFYNWDLLLQLVAASFSSTYIFDFNDYDDNESTFFKKNIPELNVCVNSGGSSVSRNISELNNTQISILHNIYMEELINFQHIELSSPDYVMYERKIKIQLYQKHYHKANEIIQRWEVLK